MKVLWEDSLSVNNESLDCQHKKLIDLFNSAADVQIQNPNSEKFSDLLQALSRYSQEHFSQEEEYMQEIGFPDLEKHKKLHKTFKEKVACFCLEAFSQSDTVVSETLDYLTDWIVNHIENTDQMYRQFADSQ